MDPWEFPNFTEPWLRAVMVSSLDGASTDPAGRSGAMGGPADKAFFGRMRALADVVLVGANTARVEGYRPDPNVPIAVVSRSGDIPSALHDQRRYIGEADWPAIIADLAEQGLRRISCEGGPTLLGQLAAHDLIDELVLTTAPVIFSGSAPRITGDGPLVDRRFRLVHVEQVADVLFSRWIRDRALQSAT